MIYQPISHDQDLKSTFTLPASYCTRSQEKINASRWSSALSRLPDLKRHHPHIAGPTDLLPPLRPDAQPPWDVPLADSLPQQFRPTGIGVPPCRGALIRTLLFHRKSHAASRACSCVGNTNQQNGDLPRLPPLLYQVPGGMRPGQTNDQGTSRPHGCHYHHGLYPRPKQDPHWARSLADAL